MDFVRFLTEAEKEEDEVEKTLAKIPKAHRELVKGYRFRFQPGNTLKGDDGHIGFIDEKNKTITIASPWNYGREFTLLHEVAHAVWKYLMDARKRGEWKKLLAPVKRRNRKDLDQNDEEIFCMIYAQQYAGNKITKYDHESLTRFVRGI